MAYLRVNLDRVRKITPTTEEIQFRVNKFSDSSVVTRQKLSCTVCGIDIKHRLVTENNVHPQLDVLMCHKCNHFYCNRILGPEGTTSRSTATNHCGWCAKEKFLSPCVSCSTKFCKDCIHRNTTVRDWCSMLQAIQNNKWKCIKCESKPIWSQRALCAVAVEHNKAVAKQLEERRTKVNTTRLLRRSESVKANGDNKPALSMTNASTPRRTTSVPHLCATPQSENNTLTTKQNTEENNKPTVRSTVQKEASKDESSEKICVICLENDACMVLYRCGHMCLCPDCLTKLTEGEDHQCPICRNCFTDAMKVYF